MDLLELIQVFPVKLLQEHHLVHQEELPLQYLERFPVNLLEEFPVDLLEESSSNFLLEFLEEFAAAFLEEFPAKLSGGTSSDVSEGILSGPKFTNFPNFVWANIYEGEVSDDQK